MKLRNCETIRKNYALTDLDLGSSVSAILSPDYCQIHVLGGARSLVM